jgi:HlyD family secretion protein
MKLPEYREGDQVGPGTLVAEVMNLEQMVIQCKVDEGDRANLNTGASVEAHVDALPGRVFPAKVESVAGTASRGMPWSGNTTSKFDVSITLDKSESGIRPGLTVQAVVEGGQTKNLLLVPPQALFEKDGKPFVYLQRGGDFVERQVKVTVRTESQVAIEGVDEGAQVALINPEEQPKKTATSASSQPALVGGGGR